MLQIFFKTIKSKNFSKAARIRLGSWINLENPSKAELMDIAQLINLKYEDIRDSHDIHEIPRLERKDHKLIVFVRCPSHDQNDDRQGLYTKTLTLIVTREYFITISPNRNELIYELIRDEVNLATTQQSKLFIYIMLRIAREFTKKINEVNGQVGNQRSTLKQVDEEDIASLIKSEAIVNQYLSALVPMENIFGTILSTDLIKQYQDDKELYNDLLIDIHQSVDLSKVILKSIVSLRDSYQIIFTNKLNKVIKFFTSFTIIMTIPTIMASLFGMNVKLPIETHPAAFWVIIWIILIISILTMYIFYRKKWL